MGLFSKVGDFLTGSNSQSVGRSADELLVDVNAPGASASFDSDTNAITSKLDPRHKAFQQLLFGIGEGLLGQFQGQDFGNMAQDQFDLLSSIGSRDREQQRLSLENRLFNQGLLGSTAGANQLTAFQEGQANASLGREVAARDFANQFRNTLFQQGLQSLGGVTTLDSLGMAPIGLMNLGEGRANMLAQERLRSSDIGAGLFNQLIGAAKTAATAGAGGPPGGAA